MQGSCTWSASTPVHTPKQMLIHRRTVGSAHIHPLEPLSIYVHAKITANVLVQKQKQKQRQSPPALSAWDTYSAAGSSKWRRPPTRVCSGAGPYRHGMCHQHQAQRKNVGFIYKFSPFLPLSRTCTSVCAIDLA